MYQHEYGTCRKFILGKDKEYHNEQTNQTLSEVRVMLGAASNAWEKLVGHIRFYYEGSLLKFRTV